MLFGCEFDRSFTCLGMAFVCKGSANMCKHDNADMCPRRTGDDGACKKTIVLPRDNQLTSTFTSAQLAYRYGFPILKEKTNRRAQALRTSTHCGTI